MSLLRKKYLESLYEAKLTKLRNSIGTEDVYFIVDETTDVEQRCVLNIMVGCLNGTKTKSYLLSTQFLTSVNNETVAQAIITSLCLLWKGVIHYDRLLLVVTDQAKYMIKAIGNLKTGLFKS